MITVWDVLRHRFHDSAVFDLLDGKVPTSSYDGKVYYPLYVHDIAGKLGRSEKSVIRSLKRLKKGKMGDLVIEGGPGQYYSKANSPKH